MDRSHYWNELSLAWIGELALDRQAAIVDVGGGASTLVDDLIDDGFESIAVLDISDNALAISRQRLGRQADLVMWLSGDVTSYRLPDHRFDLWHDRAALHFLVDPADAAAYRENLVMALKPGGHCIISVFSPAAPGKCSGLPVRRYDEDALAGFLGEGFERLRHKEEIHVTPGGDEQNYLSCLFRRTAG